MTLETKTWIITLLCLLLVVGSIAQYRWLLLNKTQITQGMVVADKNLQALRHLKNKVDEFNAAATRLGNDERLHRSYYDKKIAYHNELGREGVEKIDEVLQTLYLRDAFFELSHFSLKHAAPSSSNHLPQIKFLIEGNRRLIEK